MTERRFWAIVPAAGSGARMHAAVPKQYLTLDGKTVLERTLESLLGSGAFQRLVVVLAPGDEHWRELPLAGDARIVTATGAAHRCLSVYEGLLRLSELAAPDDLVAVHDAARPCLTRQDLQRVLEAAKAHPDGALLAAPVSDTLKRAGDDHLVCDTVERSQLWRALTPQVFPLGPLQAGLRAALERDLLPTDEAQAMELAGCRPKLVQASGDNPKITRPDDLLLARILLERAREQ